MTLHLIVMTTTLCLLHSATTTTTITAQQHVQPPLPTLDNSGELFNTPFRQPDYFQRLERAFSETARLNQTKSSYQEVSAFARTFSALSPERVRDAVVSFLDGAASERDSVVREGSAGRLETGGASSPWGAYVVSQVCTQDVADTVLGWANRTAWAMQMLDALGKPPAGVALGGNKWLGGYRQCGKVRAFTNTTDQPAFSGKYCTAKVRLNSQTISLPKIEIGVCIPSSCSEMDMTRIIDDILIREGRKERVGVSCLPPPPDSLDTKAVVAVVICAVLLTCMVLGTCLDVLHVQMPQWREETLTTSTITTNDHSVKVDESSSLLVGSKTATTTNPVHIGTGTKILLTFSVYTNASKLLSTRQAPGSLTCVHGIRFLSMTWVVLGHAFVLPYSFTANALEYTEIVQPRWSFQAISNATVSVDSFFVLSGLLVAYLSLKEMQKKSGKINWFLFYFHRFWRLTPAYMLVIMVSTCFGPYWQEGPLAYGSTDPNCPDNWWTNILYVNNLVKADKMCLPQSWYLANDMQFYILSPLIFVPFYFSPLLGYISSFLFLLGTAIAPGIIESQQYFAPAAFTVIEGNHKSTEDGFSYYYVKPWNRMGPYVIGLMAGYFLYRTDCKLRINKAVNTLLWAVMTGVALGTLYGLYDASNGSPMTIGVASFYVAVSRQVWGVCVAWVVVACCTGNGGYVNTILSWPGLLPLSRLTYCIYLLHIMIMDLYMLNLNTLMYMSDVTIVMFFLGILVVSYMAAFVATLAFEAPMIGLEKLLLGRFTAPRHRPQNRPHVAGHRK